MVSSLQDWSSCTGQCKMKVQAFLEEAGRAPGIQKLVLVCEGPTVIAVTTYEVLLRHEGPLPCFAGCPGLQG
jgi:hypothetical protein